MQTAHGVQRSLNTINELNSNPVEIDIKRLINHTFFHWEKREGKR